MTFWIAGVLVVIMLVVQLGIAAGRRDGKGLARAGIGLAQFAVLTGGWVAYTVAVTAAVGGLTRSVMGSLLGVTSWNSWQPWTSFDTKQVTDAGLATVLGLLGLLMWIAAIGHLLVILARDAALMVLVATGPIAAAGLVNDTTRAWFWKTFRWFHAAVATPLLVVIVTGVGTKFAEGVAAGKAGLDRSLGRHHAAGDRADLHRRDLPSCVVQVAGVRRPGHRVGGVDARRPASISGRHARSPWRKPDCRCHRRRATTPRPRWQRRRTAGEASADAATTSRVAGVVQQAGSFLGPVGAGLAMGIGVMTRVGTVGTSVLTDMTNQEGVGHNTYQPDYQDGRRDGAARANREANADSANSPDPDTETPIRQRHADHQPLRTRPPAPAPTSAAAGADGAGRVRAAAGGAGRVEVVAAVLVVRRAAEVAVVAL